MRKKLTRPAHRMIERALLHFPELKRATITVGYTRANLGSATLRGRSAAMPQLIIRLRVRKLSYQTVGHELTHLVQGLAQRSAKKIPPSGKAKIPSGEKACDIWTLARDRLFCDDPPSYLRMPRTIRERWPEHAESVRALCIAAIKKRASHRFYIRWLESKIRELARGDPAAMSEDRQLNLPF